MSDPDEIKHKQQHGGGWIQEYRAKGDLLVRDGGYSVLLGMWRVGGDE